MNPLAIITPTQKATPTAFLIGLIILAVADAAKTWFGLSLGAGEVGQTFGYISMALFFLVLLFISFLFINRRRDAGEGVMLFLLPVILGTLACFIVSGTLAAIGSFELMGEYAETLGRDVMTVAQDPSFQAEFQTWLEENEAAAARMANPVSWGGFAGLWVPTFLFGLWFMSMKNVDEDE